MFGSVDKPYKRVGFSCLVLRHCSYICSLPLESWIAYCVGLKTELRSCARGVDDVASSITINKQVQNSRGCWVSYAGVVGILTFYI